MSYEPKMEGKKVPQVTFRTRKDSDWVNVTSDDLFKGKTVIVFSLPGAFTPTCSSTHLPRYNELGPVFKKHGVDAIVCMSVNDAFVMNAWAEDQHAEHLTLIPDGNGDFTEGMGLLVDKKDLGFGKRSWRYSMLVKDGTVDKMFIEPDKPGDPFEVSDADTMLNYIAPAADVPPVITLFTRDGCPFCAKAKSLLDGRGLQYSEIKLHRDVSIHAMRGVTGKHTVPQVYFEGKHIGGSEDLEAYLAK
jgi:glutaredoxin-like protein